MSVIYAHLPVDENIGFNERSYVVTEEKMEFREREVLYLYVTASEITFCDGRYASYLGTVNVKGYVRRWKYGTDDKGDELSEIEPIENDGDKREISDMLRTRYGVLLETCHLLSRPSGYL